ncbi:MAG: response regulator transcription factor [Anaerolineales bacterium]
MSDREIRVLIVSELRLVCNMISSLLEDEPDIEVVGVATNVSEALNKKVEYDMMLVSASLPDNGALELTNLVVEDDPEVKVLILGMTESKAHVIQYVEAGASGYVLKDNSVDELLKRIRITSEDKAVVSPKIAGALMSRLTSLAQLFSDVEAIVDEPADLTPREKEILMLIGEGYSNQDIADHLVIELGTVKNHVHSILQKLGVQNRTEAAAYLALIRASED